MIGYSPSQMAAQQWVHQDLGTKPVNGELDMCLVTGLTVPCRTAVVSLLSNASSTPGHLERINAGNRHTLVQGGCHQECEDTSCWIRRKWLVSIELFSDQQRQDRDRPRKVVAREGLHGRSRKKAVHQQRPAVCGRRKPG